MHNIYIYIIYIYIHNIYIHDIYIYIYHNKYIYIEYIYIYTDHKCGYYGIYVGCNQLILSYYVWDISLSPKKSSKWHIQDDWG